MVGEPTADWGDQPGGDDRVLVSVAVDAPGGAGTQVRFYHAGWNSVTEHFRISTYCWAMYLRILRRNLEFGEQVPYSERLSV